MGVHESMIMRAGNIKLIELKNNSLLNISPRAGVYWYEIDKPVMEPKFKDDNPAGHYKGDPTVSEKNKLSDKWVKDAITLYIGRSNNLCKRIILRAQFAKGESVRAWGGRYLWQLSDDIQKKMRIRWEECANPKQRERDEIKKFKDAHEGKLPFANLVTPK